jgi:hypothetical protein
MDLCNAENAINLGEGEAASIEDGSCSPFSTFASLEGHV